MIFLTADAFGVLPPVASLSPAHAMYHFISGYTAKVAGTEMGVTEPQATFSPCFGGPFLVWHPNKYAELLAEKMRKHNARVWLVNTGWSGGGYGVGKRISLKNTRAIIDAIHTGALANPKTERDPVFGFDVVTEVPGVPSEILRPRKAWPDKAAYDATAKKLAGLFNKNFETYAAGRERGGEGGGARRRETNGVPDDQERSTPLDTANAILHLNPRSALERADFEQFAQAVDPVHRRAAADLAGMIIETPGFPGWSSFGAMAAHMRFVQRSSPAHQEDCESVTRLRAR